MRSTQTDESVQAETATSLNRRSLVGRVGAGAATAAAVGALAAGGVLTSVPAQAQTPSVADVLNFALNTEYLEAEFYLRAVTGQGLPADLITGPGIPGNVNGGVSGGRAVPFRSPAIQKYAEKIAVDELAHVRYLRAVLGSGAVARPQIDFATAFNTLGLAAGLIVPGQSFDPFADDISFLVGAFSLSDVGVTAYAGSSRFLSGDILEAASGILAVEAYHAGAVRTLLANFGGGPTVNKVAALRQALTSPTVPYEQGLSLPENAYNFVPTDINGLAFRRTPQQVLRVLYGTPNAGVPRGQFFPNGVNGTLRVT